MDSVQIWKIWTDFPTRQFQLLEQGIIGRAKGYYTNGAELVESVGCGSKTGREL